MEVKKQEEPSQKLGRNCGSCRHHAPNQPILIPIPPDPRKIEIAGAAKQGRCFALCICENKESPRFGGMLVIQASCDQWTGIDEPEKKETDDV